MSTFLGWLGELMTRFGMWLFLDKKVYSRFHNVIVPTSNGTTQIDHLLVCKFGVFVIETKNIKGWIFGSEHQPRWTQSLFGKKYSFQNPLRQNYRHTEAIAEHLDLDRSHVHSVVFFIGDCKFKTAMPANVLCSGLSSYIRSFSESLLSEEDVAQVTERITALKADRQLTTANHLRSLRERHGSTTTCPTCGSALVARTAAKGKHAGSSFLGCSTFPKCRYTARATAASN